ncbi:uncharacterized protein LOC133744735 [Rosa rugosa]|uniref:uncharacterized protein LOC133744735 n=1 Tax=Rosa rugosa TaxID=74645 RepID=UPI002B40B884|nr:uncharacterized protein LOC133744735 [Rosa rugosa]
MAAGSPITPKPSYAATLAADSPLPFAIADLPAPFTEDGLVSVRIFEEPFLRGLDRCKTNLIGRATVPTKTPELVQQLKSLWSNLNPWTVAPLGRGFFMLQFSTLIDMQRVWSLGSVRLSSGMLRLIKWSPDFSPLTYKNSFAQVWIRLWDLSFAYWDQQTLFEIASGIGTPLKLDPRTKNRTNGLYAKILVDVDFSQSPPDKLRITRANGEVVIVGVEFESVPAVCSKCGIVGHVASSCQVIQEANIDIPTLRGRSVERTTRRRRKARSRKTDSAAVPISTSTQVVIPGFESLPSMPDARTIAHVSQHNALQQTEQLIEPSAEPIRAQAGDAQVQRVEEVQASSSLSVPPGFQRVLPGTEQELVPLDEVSSACVHTVEVEEGEFTPVISKKNKKLQKYEAVLKPKAVLPSSLWKMLNLSLCATNDRGSQAPNLWLLCPIDVRPTLLSATDQQITISCSLDGVACTITAVYARTTIQGRRQLWHDLSVIHQNGIQGPWLMLGDFNCVLGAHEKRGGNVPNAIACRDFQQMCTSCGMLDIDTKEVFYTWSNGRTDVRLDRAFGNSDWFEAWAAFECRALTKASSDHHPIMVTCSRLTFIPHAPFRFQGMWLQHPGFLAMVRDFWTSLAIYGCPMYILATKLRALKAMLKAWNINSFGDINQRVKASRAALDSVQQEISDLGPTEDRIRCEEMATLSYQTDLSMQESFLRSKARVRWLIEGDRNTAFLHNLVKIRRVHKSLTSIKVGSQVFHGQDQIAQQVVHHFEALFSRDSTITDTGLVNRTIPALVTEAENLSLTTRPTVEEIHEAVLNLDGSSAPGPDGFGGIFFQQCWEVVALDVIAAVNSFFDNGFFLPHFNSSLLILVPKKDEADSISDYRPIALANFTFKVITKILADRLGNPRSLRALMKFLEEYAINSGQVVSKNKSSVFLGKYAQRRKVFIQHVLGIREGSLPFTYLGVPIFKGCPKPSYFQAIADKVRCSLSSWKGKQLSQAARLQLISSVTQSQLLHSFQVYSWPRPLLLKVQQWTRYFFWSGDPLKKGLALIAWDTCCRPLDQGGLGLKNLFHFNRALLLKNCWNIVNSSSPSAAFLRERFFSSDLCLLQYYQRSSVWPGLKKLWDSFYASVQWLVGDGSRISFCSENWLGTPISSMHRITPVVRSLMPVKVSDFIRDKQWAIPSTFNFFFPDLASRISKVVLPLENGVDQVIWPHNAAGVLTSKEAFDFISPPKPKVDWCKLIWHKALQPRKSLVAWKVLNKRILTDDWLVRRGIYLCSQCSICRSQGESLHHLFFDCSLVHEFWVWLASFFRISLLPGASLVDLISPDTLIGLASSSKILWSFAFCNALWCIWTERNKIRFQEATFNLARFQHWFLTSLKESASIHFMPCSNASSMQGLFAVLGLSSLTVKAPKYIPVQWIPPPIQWLKVNTDGSFRSIEMAGFGGIFRDHEGHFRGAFAQKVEAPCAIDAEVLAVIEAMRIAWAKSWTHIWLETDSILVVQYFKNPNLIPWRLRIAWYNCLYLTRMIHFRVSHTFREGNTVADALANHGALNEGYNWWDDVPTFIARPYGRDLSSMINYRFR